MPPAASHPTQLPTESLAITHTRIWLERTVIGLQLCPFAKRVCDEGQLRFCVSSARTEPQLLADLRRELVDLNAADPAKQQTTLLIAPEVLGDFLDYNDFLDLADALLQELDLEGVIQIASFHPKYQFAGTQASDVTNCTNRSPYPSLHLLREDSVEHAIDQHPDPSKIPERNMARLRKLGLAGWQALQPRLR